MSAQELGGKLDSPIVFDAADRITDAIDGDDYVSGMDSMRVPEQGLRSGPVRTESARNTGRSMPKSPRAASSRSPRHKRSGPQPSQEDVSGISQKFLTGQEVKCDDPGLLASTVRDLEEHRNQLMVDGSFQESLKCQKAIDTARAQQLEACKKVNQQEVHEGVISRKREAQQEYEAFQQEMKQRESDLEARLKEQLAQVKERQRKQLEEHDKEWQSEGKQRQFNRSSQKLRVLRTQQQLLMNAKRFSEAAQVCKIADGLAEKETKENHHQMLTAFYQSRSLLERKHANEIDTVMKAFEVKRGEFKYQKETLELRHINRKNTLDIEENAAKDPERLWVRQHRNDGDMIMTYTGTTANRGMKMNRTADVNEFNTLPLPPLPIPKGPVTAKKDPMQKSGPQQFQPVEEN